MDPITREQMVEQFGETGVQNPTVIDLIRYDPDIAKVVLHMYERRAWGASDRQFAQIEEKINRYLEYVLKGFLAEHYPQYLGMRIQIRLECAEEPHGEAVQFVEAAKNAIAAQGVEFALRVTPPAAA